MKKDPVNSNNRSCTHSTLREYIVQHLFIGEVLRTLWQRDVTNVEILRPEFDAHGYDVVMSRGAIVRNIQLKTGKNSAIWAGNALAEKPGGCIIWIGLDNKTLELGPYWWFGNAPGRPLPSISSFSNPRRQGPNCSGKKPLRKNHREIPRKAFTKLETLDEVINKLFGQK